MVTRLISLNRWTFFACLLPLFLLSGCNGFLPASGPSTSALVDAKTEQGIKGIQVVEITDTVARGLNSKQAYQRFSDLLPSQVDTTFRVGVGDVVEALLWEAPPAALFGVASNDLRSGAATTRAAVFPEQMVNSDGNISIPFVGQVQAANRTIRQIEQDIEKGLKGKAHQPQVMVRVVKNFASNVTLIGEMGASTRMPLTPRGERLLDAVAAGGGVRQPVNKMSMQLTRGDKVYTMPLEAIIRDPRQNVVLLPGDVVTALFQSYSFTALGATGRNQEVGFEALGITLAQALARSASLQDMRADAEGVFIFRFEEANALDWPVKPVVLSPDNRVPVVYRLNLRDPACFLVAQNFQMKDRDVLYVSNAPAAELQKFLNLISAFTGQLSNGLGAAY